MAVRRKHIRSLVESLLQKQQIRSAPIPVVDIARALGVEVRLEGVDDKLSGFLFRDVSRQKAVIGTNKRHHPNRQRFTIAHELGHFLLHEGEVVHIDGEDVALQINLRAEKASEGTNDNEKEANLFAAELLMPASFLARDLAGMARTDLLDELKVSDVLTPLAEKYEVSTQALTFRLSYLRYIVS